MTEPEIQMPDRVVSRLYRPMHDRGWPTHRARDRRRKRARSSLRRHPQLTKKAR